MSKDSAAPTTHATNPAASQCCKVPGVRSLPARPSQANSPQVAANAGRLLQYTNGLAQHVDIQGNGALDARPLHLDCHLLPVCRQRGAVHLRYRQTGAASHL